MIDAWRCKVLSDVPPENCRSLPVLSAWVRERMETNTGSLEAIENAMIILHELTGETGRVYTMHDVFVLVFIHMTYPPLHASQSVPPMNQRRLVSRSGHTHRSLLRLLTK